MRHITPEVRAELVDHMTFACLQWSEDLLRGFFDEPNCALAHEMLLEAYAEAVAIRAKQDPRQKAAVQTFIFELQDRLNKESK